MLHRWDLLEREKGGRNVGKTKRGKGTKIMAIGDAAGLPVAVHMAAASPHEVTLVASTLAARFVRTTPQRLIGDKASDSDPLDRTLSARYEIEMIAPHKKNRVRAVTQDGRVLQRSRRRWKIERLNAWLQNFRRIVTRSEYRAENFLGFVQLGCMLILLRNYFLRLVLSVDFVGLQIN